MSEAPEPIGAARPFEGVVERHGATVLHVVRAVLGAGADADDAWSETFLAALRAWPDLPAGANVEAWLVTVAHRKALDVTRGRARRAVPVADPPQVAGGSGRADAPQGAGRAGDASGGSGSGWPGGVTAGSTDHARLLDLRAAVAALPRRQREAVAYHHLAGLPHAEIAALVGSTPAAVRRAAADGVAALRRTTSLEGP